MCGISGIFDLDNASIADQELAVQAISAMNRSIAHRGPDDDGVELIDGLAFGHRRLSIIDLESGQQPMYSTDKSVLISFNGEIFNYIELRSELENSYNFSTSSDTEVILAAFMRWNEKCFSKLNGQFAIALYDCEKRRLYLARDRLGEKPLYWARYGRKLVFASELKSIVEFKGIFGIDSQVCLESFSHYLALNYVPFDRTFLAEVKQLEPAHYMSIDCSQTLKKCYWDPDYWDPDSATQNSSLSDSISEFESILSDSARMRVRSDVPVGIFLSGGVDSSIVACSAVQHTSELTAFSADFREKSFSEMNLARLVANTLSLEQHEFQIDPLEHSLPDLVEKLAYHGDQPLADSSSLPFYLLSRETAKNLKVVLSGDGGDELFAGYLTYRATDLSRAIPAAFRRVGYHLRFLANILPASNRKVGFFEKLDRFLRNLDLEPGASHFAWNGMWRADLKSKLMHPDVIGQLSSLASFDELARKLGVDLQQPDLKQLMLADQKNYLSNDILAKADRMSMAHGLEVRPVLLDHRLVEFARRLDPAHLVDQRWNWKNPLSQWRSPGKVLLREYLKQKIPSYPVNTKKQGFSIPIHLWFRTYLKDFSADLFQSKLVKESGLYNPEFLWTLWTQHQQRKANLGFELWGILISLLWLQTFTTPRCQSTRGA